ncbi:MAG: flagellar biosynthesis anti-sigma factor FlgM [Desulfobulbaceae bacterium]|nr:MAG: flagellar biosynthesis anti-sigma factor FlgM [Desulfobulbaceae bacterium]
MSIEFFGVGGPPNIGGVKKGAKGEASKTDATGKSDQVEFSSVLQDVHKAKETGNPEEAARAARVQELKQQVASGSYEPDIQKVAGSLLQFLVENNKS